MQCSRGDLNASLKIQSWLKVHPFPSFWFYETWRMMKWTAQCIVILNQGFQIGEIIFLSLAGYQASGINGQTSPSMLTQSKVISPGIRGFPNEGGKSWTFAPSAACELIKIRGWKSICRPHGWYGNTMLEICGGLGLLLFCGTRVNPEGRVISIYCYGFLWE